MDLIITILLGALAGWIASMIMKTDSQQGFLLDIVVGIIGASLGKWLFGILGFSLGMGLIGSLITAIIGACVLLFVVKLIMSMVRR